MMNMDDIGLEYRSAAVLGLAALVLSTVAGAAAGNGAGHVIWRSLVLMIVFAALGYLAVYVIRKYVPEVFEALASAPGAVSEEGLKVLPVEEGAAPKEPAGPVEARPEGDIPPEEPGPAPTASRKEGFVPFKEDDFTAYSSARPVEGKLGKHFFEQKNIRYEPKIMAEAIRTMIARDKE